MSGLNDLLARATSGTLTPAEIELVARHLHAHQPERVRVAAAEVAGAYLARVLNPTLMYALVEISESRDETSDEVKTACVRALAKATGYHGQRIALFDDESR